MIIMGSAGTGISLHCQGRAPLSLEFLVCPNTLPAQRLCPPLVAAAAMGPR